MHFPTTLLYTITLKSNSHAQKLHPKSQLQPFLLLIEAIDGIGSGGGHVIPLQRERGDSRLGTLQPCARHPRLRRVHGAYRRSSGKRLAFLVMEGGRAILIQDHFPMHVAFRRKMHDGIMKFYESSIASFGQWSTMKSRLQLKYEIPKKLNGLAIGWESDETIIKKSKSLRCRRQMGLPLS